MLINKRNHNLKKSIAIIGSGIAGLSTAYFSQEYFDVTLFEKNDYLGGHANTREVKDSNGNTIPIDTGFIVYNELTYPNLTKFFEVDKEHIVAYTLSALASEQLIGTMDAKLAMKKYKIDQEKLFPTKL